MRDPERLLDDGASDLELALLRAGHTDVPSDKARQAALAALGLSGAVLSASSSAAASSTALSSGARVLAAKWWAVGALVTAAGAAGLGYATFSGGPTAVPSVSATRPPMPAPRVTGPALEPMPEAATPPPSPAAIPRERGTTPQPHTSSSSGAPGIQEQIALIDRARSAVAAGQPAVAMAALDEYQRRFPGGVLTQEATLLRIETLLARGDKASAARLGQRFLQRYPRSAMAARVRALIDG
ncbi:MAG TPA: hypothetical protein VHB79_06445 [Polyangiaceae bacterium]|nr:hypothetical protein [Polyangiaceae bacterium]